MEEKQLIKQFQELQEYGSTSLGYSAIQILSSIVQNSSQTTMVGIKKELDQASQILENYIKSQINITGKTSLSVKAACDIFKHQIHKTLSDGSFSNIQEIRQSIIEQSIDLAQARESSLHKISDAAQHCFRDNLTILVYGYSTVILDILSQVAKKYRISVVTTECRPFGEGYAMARDISDLGLPCRIITDNAVVAVIENIDFVVVGAEAVMENGGIINRIGTHNLAIISKAFNTPFYVFAESLKFLRFFPLSQRDIPEYTQGQLNALQQISEEVTTQIPYCDLTPPNLITFLFTDLGILPPGAVSDELIQLYA